MIPLELTIDGLHSYREPVTIPFDELTGARFFGIFGPTGSGKSTILDAITLALYGRVDRLSGNEVTPMVNANRDAMEVVFRFRLGETTYRARRRFTRTNDGAVRQRDAEIVDEDDGVALASQARKVDETVQRLLGMDFGKFTRAVFLPQGKFAQFLEDDPADRVKLLEELFGYGRFGEVLRRKVRRRRDEVADEHANLEGQLEQLAAYDEETLEALEAEHDDVAERVDGLEAERETLEAKVQRARELASLVEDREEAREELAALDEEAETIDALRDELEAARAAASPYRLIRDLREDRAAIDAVEEDLETLELELEQAQTELEAFLEEREARQTELEETREELIRAADAIEELGAEQDRLVDLREERSTLRTRLETEPPETEPPRPEHLDLDAARALVQDAADARHRAQRADDLRTRLTDQGTTVSELEAELEALDEEASTLEARLEDADAELEQLEEEREALVVSQRAAVLVDALEPGDPCPVCGAEEHPDPAQPPKTPLTKLEDAIGDTREAREQALKRQEAVRSRRTTLAEQLEDERADIEATQESLAEARTDLQQRREALGIDALAELSWTGIHERAQAWVAQLEHQQHAERLDEIQAQLSRSQERWTAVRSVLDVEADAPTRSALDAARRACLDQRDDVRASLEALEAREDELEAAVQTLREERSGKRERIETVRERAASREAELETLLDESPFEDAAEVEEAYREPGRVEAIQARVTEHEEARRGVQRDLERLSEAIDAIDLSPSEAGAVTERFSELEETLNEVRTQRDKLAQRLEDHRTKLEQRRTLEERYETVDERLGHLQALHDLLRGRGFVKYLAQARFEQVLAQASQRLAQISGGHYHLEGDPDEIRVVDHMAGGAKRDLRTLSGGETFMVSLSLALALSDAIQNERGGGYAPIEFFFLDEGFGSLDRDTLDAVMHLLQDLSDEGIRVGLITHVEAAKRYVPARLEVEPPSEETGSQASVIG